MYNIKHGYGCGIKATLLTASGEVCDLRRARYKGAVLVLPNGSTIPCADVSVDDITNTMYVRLLGDRELTTIGRYGILFNVKLANGVMYSSPIVMFADVQDDAEMEYRELNISIAVTVTYLPANVAYTGASPKISPNGTWLVYNDELNAYEDTGEPASYAGVVGNIQELHEQIDERTTTTYITEAVDVDWKTVGKNAEGKLCVIGGDTQVADFIEGYLLANGYAKLSELAKIFASIEWIEGKKYITDADIPSLVSAFTNDKGYITLDAIAPYAKKATTLGGYGITNAYTKEETESRFFAFTKIDNETIKRNGDGFMYVDFSNVPTSIFDGLPIDNETIYWDNGVLKAMGGGGGGGVADSVAWANVYGKPTWITNTKPTYNYSEINGTPDLSIYALASAIPTNNNQLTNGAGYITASALNGYATQTFVNTAVNGAKEWVEEQQYLTEITSGMIESVLGYQPYDGDTNRLGFLTSSALNGYATQSWVNTALAGYLPKSGGTINGTLTATGDLSANGMVRGTAYLSTGHVQVSSNIDASVRTSIFGDAESHLGQIKAFRSGSSAVGSLAGAYASGILFAMNDTHGFLQIPSSANRTGEATIGGGNGDKILWSAKLLHSGNYSNYALPLSGGTVNGSITASSFIGNLTGNTANIGTLQIITNEINGANGTGNAHINYSSTGKVTIANGGGNVAIGGTTADEKLHVHGNAQITGNLIFDSSHQTLISRKLNSTGETAIFTQVNSDDNLLIGQGIAKAGKNTYIYGKEIDFCYGTAGSTSSTAMHIYSNGDVAMSRIYLYPQTQALNASSGVLRFYSTRDTISGPSIQGVHAQQGYGAKHLVFYQHNTGGYTEYEAMRLTYDGNLVIGGTTANAKLHVYGNLLTEGGITMYSQRSLKNILSYEGLSLEQLSVIKPIKFTWKDGRDNRYHVGGVADDVETVVPEVVYSANDFLTMDYGNAGFYVAASLIKPVLNHEHRIKQLEQENKVLHEEINQLRQSA